MVIVWCSNGILLASSFHTALFSLVTALVIYSAKDLVCLAYYACTVPLLHRSVGLFKLTLP